MLGRPAKERAKRDAKEAKERVKTEAEEAKKAEQAEKEAKREAEPAAKEEAKREAERAAKGEAKREAKEAKERAITSGLVTRPGKALGRRVTGAFLIVTLVLLVASLFGVYKAFTLPTEIEAQIPVLDYEHEGRFDYLIYLKPSYLFGPEPQEPPPPPELPPQSNPKYPTEIIRTFKLTFSYCFTCDKPVTEITEEVEVTAVLVKPDVEAEEIILVPKTTKTGDFTVDFSLDTSDLTSSSRITINAYVCTMAKTDSGAIFEDFAQSLAMRSTNSLLEVDKELTSTQQGALGEVSYEQQGEFDYAVRLKSSSIFGAITLKPPSVPTPPPPPPPPPPPEILEPGETIFTKLVDSMEATFSYYFESDRPVSQVVEEVEINAVLGDAETWSKTFVLVPRTSKSGDFTITFPLDLDHFTEAFTAIEKETGVSASRNIAIMADVHTVAQTDFGEIDEVFSQTLSTTLGRGTLEWNEELVKSKPGSIETTQMIPNAKKFLGLSVSAARNLSAIGAGVFFLFFVSLAVLYARSRPAELPQIDKEVQRVKKKYGERMAEATSQTPMEGEKIISVGSMEDLIKVADELSKPIIHQVPTKSQEPHAYYVFDGATRYQYVLTVGTKGQGTNGGKTE